MQRSLLPLVSILFSALMAPLANARPLPVSGPLVLEDGDLIVLLGDTFIERDGNFGYLETALTAAHPGKRLRFRNLGWSGDTPRAESRAYFGPPAEGFDRLREQLANLKPSVVISCYGAVDAWKEEAGRGDFVKSYERLLDMIGETGAGVVLMSPPAVQTLPPPFPDLSEQNRNIAATTAAIAELAKERNLRFADLFGAMGTAPVESTNGVTFTANGYQSLVPAFLKALDVPVPDKIPDQLRPLVVEKNQLYFYRWRPQNEIYLFGARKHEQGNNASEVQLFEPLVSGKETVIHELLAGPR